MSRRKKLPFEIQIFEHENNECTRYVFPKNDNNYPLYTDVKKDIERFQSKQIRRNK